MSNLIRLPLNTLYVTQWYNERKTFPWITKKQRGYLWKLWEKPGSLSVAFPNTRELIHQMFTAHKVSMDLKFYLVEGHIHSHKTPDQIVLWLGEMCPRFTGCFDSDWHHILAVWQSGDFTIHFLVLAFNPVWHILTKLNTKWLTVCSFKKGFQASFFSNKGCSVQTPSLSNRKQWEEKC